MGTEASLLEESTFEFLPEGWVGFDRMMALGSWGAKVFPVRGGNSRCEGRESWKGPVFEENVGEHTLTILGIAQN